MATKQKYISLILPVGEAVWPHLNEIEVYKVTDKKGRPVMDKETGEQQVKRRYITNMRYDQATLQTISGMLVDAATKLGADDDIIENLKSFGKNTPFKTRKIKDSDGEVTGKEILLEARSGEKNRPGLFDAKRQSFPLSKQIGGGSKLKIKVTVNVYDGFDGGVNLYLDQVQVIELVEGGRSQECAFDETEGFVAEEGTEESLGDPDAASGDTYAL